MTAVFAAGARVVIRDCEWIVRRADPCDDGGYILTVDSLSELVNGKRARFLTRLEEEAGDIRVLEQSLVGVGLPRKAKPAELKEGTHYRIETPDRDEGRIALGWEDIQHRQEGSVYKTYMDDTLPPAEGSPGGRTERSVEYKAPFFRSDREEDYQVAWEVFANA